MALERPTTVPRLTHRLRALIDYLGVSDAAFASLVGMHGSSISRILSGERSAAGGVSPRLTQGAWRVLGMSPEYWQSDPNAEPVAFLDSRHEFTRRGGPAWLKDRLRKGDIPLELGKDLAATTANLPPTTSRVQAPASLPTIADPPAWHSDGWRFLMAKIAAERSDPPEVVAALMAEAAPPEAGVEWWVRTYLNRLEDAGIVVRRGKKR